MLPLTSLGDVSSVLGAFTLRLRDEQDVANVERTCAIVGGGEPAIEWLIDADLTSSDPLSWRPRLHWSDGAWVIEADTRRISGGASAVEREMPARTSEPGELESDLLAAAAVLVRARPPGAHDW